MTSSLDHNKNHEQPVRSSMAYFINIGFIFLIFLGGFLWGIFTYYNAPAAKTTDDMSFNEGRYVFGLVPENLKKMEADGVIKSALFARILAQALGYDTQIQKGIYRFTNRLSTLDILKLLLRGEEESVLFTIVEGYDTYDIDRELFAKQLISAKGDFIRYSHSKTVLQNIGQTLALVEDTPRIVSSEGFLYPDTYRIRLSRIKEDLIQLALEQFKSAVIPLLTQNLIPQEKWLSLMIMSSLVEKETSKLSEKKLVASVLYNRLRAAMKLRYDPTIIYALKKAGLYEANLNAEGVIKIKNKHFTFQSPYNTYAIKGLPKTPISSFTLTSIDAVLHPAQTDYLFFVARSRTTPSLGHDFSKTYEEHLKKIERYQR